MHKLIAPTLALLALSGCETSASSPTVDPNVSSTGTASPQLPMPVASSGKPSQPVADVPVQPAAAAEDAVGASNQFGFAIYQHIRSREGNLAYSPASISIALAMTYAGAKGDTAKEMRSALAFPESPDALHGGWQTMVSRFQKSGDDVEISVANRLFGDKRYTFEPAFLSLTESRYGAPLEAVDFAGDPEAQRLRINGWVAEKTKDRIEDLVPPTGVSRDTRLALVNAMYFKAAWGLPFNEDATTTAAFAAPSGSVDTKMMRQTTSMKFAEVDGVKLAEKTYKGGEFATLFVLPKEGDDLSALEKRLDAKLFEQWTSALANERVRMSLPRFEVKPDKSIELRSTLEAMGMRIPFTNAADFTGIANPPSTADQLKIEKVFHKAFVAMNEKGTEAAAATAVMMGRKGAAPGEPAVFTADRPFMFFIRDTKTGLVMFAGRVMDPTK